MDTLPAEHQHKPMSTIKLGSKDLKNKQKPEMDSASQIEAGKAGILS